MAGDVRISLGIQVDSRDGTLQRDEKLVNFQLNPDGIYKRSGTSRTTYSATAGAGYGSFVWGTHIYIWTAGNTAITPASVAL